MENDFELFLKERNITEQDCNDWMAKMDVDHFKETRSNKFYKNKSEIQGNGLFSTGNLKAGESVGNVVIHQKRTSLGRYTNHSGDPNVKFIREDSHALFMINAYAIKDISIDEELTVDYRHKELNQTLNIKTEL